MQTFQLELTDHQNKTNGSNKEDNSFVSEGGGQLDVCLESSSIIRLDPELATEMDHKISSDLQVGESTSCRLSSETRQVKLSIRFLRSKYV